MAGRYLSDRDDDDEDRRPRRSSRRRDDEDEDDDDEEEDERPSRRRQSRGQSFHCPYCDSERTPAVKREVSQVGWVVFIVLLCSVAFCWLCWIGLFIKDEKRVCRDCGMKLG